MKKLILVLLFVPAIASSQWSINEKNDPLDGKVTTVIGEGYGGDFPYRNPKLVFRIKGEKTEIYITDAGSTACDKPYLDVSFGDPNSIMSFDLSESTDNDAGFINMNETKMVFDLVKKLKEKSRAYFRFGTNCSENKFEMSLNGSSKSLSKIFSKVNTEISEISRSKLFAKKFLYDNKIELSPYDLGVIDKEIEKGVLIRKLELTEIIIENHKFLKNTIKLKLGFGGVHFRDTPYVYDKD